MLVGLDGRPLGGGPQRAIPDEALAAVLRNHETRLQALGAQQIHTGLLIEYLTETLEDKFDFEIDMDDFALFRDRRFNELKEEAKQVAKAQAEAMQAAAAVAEEGPLSPEAIRDFDIELNEFDDEEPG